MSGVRRDIYTISQAIEAFCGVSSLLSTWEREAAESLGGAGTLQGPQGTPSSKSNKSVQSILESLQRLNETLSYVNADCITHYATTTCIFTFEKAHQVDIPKETVGLVLESLEVASSEVILLTEEVYEGVVNVFREARDLCIEGDDNGVDLTTEETDCYDDDVNSVVCADSIVLSTTCTSRGRSIRPPTRLDL